MAAWESVVNGAALWSVEQGEAGAWLDSLPPQSVSMTFGSPPYEKQRTYLENGVDLGIARDTEPWVAWMVELTKKALRVTTGVVAWVVEGKTEDFAYSGSPLLLAADLIRAGIALRKPAIYVRDGIPGSGGPDWLKNKYEFIIVATNGGRLSWSDNTAMGQPPIYGPGGEMSYRAPDGRRVNGTREELRAKGVKLGGRTSRTQDGVREYRAYVPPDIANPGNLVICGSAGGSHLGNKKAHQNEAPFPEYLPEFFIRSFAEPGSIICEPFSGSGTTIAIALKWGRRGIACDLRPSQVELSKKRIKDEEGMFDHLTGEVTNEREDAEESQDRAQQEQREVDG